MLTKSPEGLDDALARFSENIEVESYPEEVEPQFIKSGLDWAAMHWPHLMPKALDSGELSDEVAAEPVGDETEEVVPPKEPTPNIPGVDPMNPCTFWQEWNGHELILNEEDGKYYEMSTYNPDSRWDWYTIGGRWRGSLRLKPGAKGVLDLPGWSSPNIPEGLPYEVADQALKAAIDLDAMRMEAMAKANETYDKFEKVVYGHLFGVEDGQAALQQVTPKNLPPAHTLLPDASWINLPHGEKGSPEEAAFTAARTQYWEHPIIKKMQDQHLIQPFGGFPNETFGMGREEFVEEAVLHAVPGFALLDLDGNWHEQGKMGWFGMSSTTPESKMEYLRRVWQVVDEAPDDTVFTMVDAHI